jgi:transcriptional regulator GlxA family with amidase domain
MVHDRLWKSDPESLKINQMTLAYGFWDNARFATDYRLHFGELPSETLKR